ncbi:MAG: alpha/beta hydrolase [Myxococcales bacterium]|nr:alpha/beta hydrolase [Myxococcales bacterium]
MHARPLAALVTLVASSALACTEDKGAAPAPHTTLVDIGERVRALGGEPCVDDPEFLCATLEMPLDHGATDGKTIAVAFAVHPAPAASRRGTLIVATGGPGYSGLDYLDDLSEYDARFPEEFDIVHFDLRGVKRSGGLECKTAAAIFYEGGLRAANAIEEKWLTGKAKTFAVECVKEMGLPEEDLPFYNTEQATEDLEAFRERLGIDELTLYGLSYGTQLTQTYSQKYPHRVRALAIDGVIDLTLDHREYMTNLHHGVSQLLRLTLEHCAENPDCAAAFDAAPGANAAEKVFAGFDAVAKELQAGAKLVLWTTTDGTEIEESYSRSALDTTTFNAVGAPVSRRDFPKALGAAYQFGDYLPLVRIFYETGGIDPDSGAAMARADADTGISNAVYYTVTCNDYGNDANSEAARVELYLSAGRALWPDGRVLSPYYGDLPCMFWPVTKPASETLPLTQAGVPVLVLGATGDNATPVDQGEATFARLEDGYLVTVEGAGHVMWGYNACADAIVTPFLLHGTRPAQEVSTCADTFVAAEAP